jgi:hypothetical protein
MVDMFNTAERGRLKITSSGSKSPVATTPRPRPELLRSTSAIFGLMTNPIFKSQERKAFVLVSKSSVSMILTGVGKVLGGFVESGGVRK